MNLRKLNQRLIIFWKNIQLIINYWMRALLTIENQMLSLQLRNYALKRFRYHESLKPPYQTLRLTLGCLTWQLLRPTIPSAYVPSCGRHLQLGFRGISRWRLRWRLLPPSYCLWVCFCLCQWRWLCCTTWRRQLALEKRHFFCLLGRQSAERLCVKK